jgi:hypothetical protein
MCPVKPRKQTPSCMPRMLKFLLPRLLVFLHLNSTSTIVGILGWFVVIVIAVFCLISHKRTQFRLPAGYDAVRLGHIRLQHSIPSSELKIHVADFLKLDTKRVRYVQLLFLLHQRLNAFYRLVWCRWLCLTQPVGSVTLAQPQPRPAKVCLLSCVFFDVQVSHEL